MALKIENHRKELVQVSQHLASSLEVVLQILGLKARLSSDQIGQLKLYIPTKVDCENETGWEESTLAAIQHLLRTNLNQGASK